MSIDGALWTNDDQMPACDPCMAGDHAACADLLWSEKYGLYACGCTNVACVEVGDS